MKKTLPLLASILGLYALAFSFNNISIHDPSSSDNSVIKSLDEGMIYMPASFSSDPEDEPYYSNQQSLVYNHINMGSTWDSYRGDKVKVAVIDTGINTTHEDFYLNGTSHISSKSLNTYYSTPTSDVHGGHTHGTQTSATILSQFNGVGTAGIAPNVEFIFFKVANASGSMPYDGIKRALNKCIEYDVDVINMSIQGYKHTVTYGGTSQQGYASADTVLKSELQDCYDAGITVVAAAGNYNTDEPSYPASFDTVISVGALYNSSSTEKASYSNYGSNIDLVAPGSVYEPNMSGNNTYSSTQGTSFSSPIVAGAIALYKSKYPSASPAEVKQKLLSSCDPLADLSTAPGWAGNGRLNVAKFLDNGPEETRVDVTGISCNDSSITMEDNSTYNITASVLPSNATKKGLRYYSSDTSIATVDLITGEVTSKKPGNCVIAIEAADDTSIRKGIPLTVNKVDVTGIELYATEVTLKENAKLTAFRAWVLPTNATNTNITYSSNNTNVAEVSKYGTITAKNEGTAVISCTTEEGNFVGTCTVTVTKDAKYLTSSSEIEFAIDLDEMEIGNSQVEQLVGFPEGLTETVDIYSTDESVLTVTNIDNSIDGMIMFDVNAISRGTADIEVKGAISLISNSFTITVTSDEPEVTLDSIVASPTKTDYFVGDLFTFKGNVTAYYSDGSSKIVTPTSISSPDMSTSGTKEVTISYTENEVTRTTSFNINVTKIILERIVYYSDFDPDIEEHYQNQEFYCHGFTRAFYNNGSNKVVTPTITKSPDVTRLGLQDVTLSYTEDGVTKTFTYQVKIIEDKVTTFRILQQPNKLTYVEGEIFDPTGLVIYVYKESGNDFELPYSPTSGITFDPVPLKQSDRFVFIKYAGLFMNVYISVVAGSSSTTVVPPPTSETTVTTIVPPTSETTITSVEPPSTTTVVPPSSTSSSSSSSAPTSIDPTTTSSTRPTSVTSIDPTSDTSIPSTSILPSTSSSQGGKDDPQRDNQTGIIIIACIGGALVAGAAIAIPLILSKRKI